MASEDKLPPLEDGLFRAMRAIDSQIQREMQRTPGQEETLGIQKWQPYQKRIEQISAFMMNCLGDADISLDSLIVLAQASSKALLLASEELGIAGLGKLRSQYCAATFEALANDAARGLRATKSDRTLV